MRCTICDWDITISFLKRFPDDDYCEHCEISILNTIKEQNDLEEREMCPECGLKYYESEVPDDCIVGYRCPMKKEESNETTYCMPT